ncbi:competence associated protein [Streptococcus pneumoniae]|nr:competence associated protein [Streptococcus pneumoniae]
MKMNKKSSYVINRLLLVIIVLILGTLALGIGLMVGYGILGKGSRSMGYPVSSKMAGIDS